ncbi:HEPN domain-containing protein [Parapedobacter luteus]|uniref:HEPN domain-containing protein n=1 Tax=Parapedobacter luteus TaxID=623280 RepID=A0A1T5AF47_9SPHI|nr:HEPN domain-containing protein [Parapedobacter luteus]SKB33594.1 HEPN domain-containing protein [Parapedobacter luteus]
MNSKNITQTPDLTLQLIIQRITENLAVEEIYLYPFRMQGKLFNQLYVLLRHESGQEIISARALCNVAVSEKAGYHAEVLFPEDVNRQINQGNIRVTLIYHPNNRVYENPNPGSRVVFQEVNYQKRYKKAARYFEKEIAKLYAFEKGYRFYMDSENYSQASFMLHQVIELGFRLAEHLIMGKAKLTHSIRKHQEYIRAVSPEMGSLFAEEEWDILRKLDESYSSARYDHDFSVSKEDLDVAADKSKALLAYLTAFNRDLLDELQRRQAEESRVMEQSENSEQTTTNHEETVDAMDVVDAVNESTEGDGPAGSGIFSAEDHRHHILAAISRYFAPTHVFCFAHQSREERSVNLVTLEKRETKRHRYYLAILTEETLEHPLRQQHQINEVLGDELEIVALYFKLGTFNKKLEEGDTFFHFLVDTAERWCSKNGLLTQSGTPEAVDLAERDWQWKRYLWSAEGMIEMAEEHIGTRHDESCAVVMAQAMEQLCLGMLHAIWGYRPDNILNLMYLIQLTESITPLASEHFCLDIPEERKMVVQLSQALNQLRYNPGYRADGYALHIVHDRLKTFSKSVEELVNYHFEEQEAVVQ